jgi:hypothetical protein
MPHPRSFASRHAGLVSLIAMSVDPLIVPNAAQYLSQQHVADTEYGDEDKQDKRQVLHGLNYTGYTGTGTICFTGLHVICRPQCPHLNFTGC